VVETIQNTVAQRDGFEAELVLVNDASPDDTWRVICELNEKYDNVRGVNIAKNSGQQSAIMEDDDCKKRKIEYTFLIHPNL
jgi:undecaprenyl-phosphate 4-deoxy-4-formamido-L-arabinose transferase